MKGILGTVAALVFLVLVQNGHAQDKPMPSSEITRLGAIVGDFEGVATVTEGGKTMNGKVRHSNSQFADGFGFLMDEIITMEDGSAYKSHNIIGYDAGGGKIHVYSVTNAGETHDHKGSWTSPTTVAVQYDGKWEAEAYVEKATLTLDGPDSYSLSWSATLGGKPAASGMEKLRRLSK